MSGPAAQLFHLEHDVSQAVVQTDHVLLLRRRSREQTSKRISAANLHARCALAGQSKQLIN